MNSRKLALIVVLGSMCSLAQGQSGKILSGQGVTTSALIDALTPAAVAPETSAEGEPIKTRSIRVIRDNESRAASTKPAQPASASLLITFEPNSADLTAKAKQSLDVVGQALNSSKLADFRFSIQGHADPSGQSEANQKLSLLRAESVREYLVKSKKIDDTRLEAVGKGDKDPINTSDPTSAENRRVTIVNLSK